MNNDVTMHTIIAPSMLEQFIIADHINRYIIQFIDLTTNKAISLSALPLMPPGNNSAHTAVISTELPIDKLQKYIKHLVYKTFNTNIVSCVGLDRSSLRQKSPRYYKNFCIGHSKMPQTDVPYLNIDLQVADDDLSATARSQTHVTERALVSLLNYYLTNYITNCSDIPLRIDRMHSFLQAVCPTAVISKKQAGCILVEHWPTADRKYNKININEITGLSSSLIEINIHKLSITSACI
jgi:hypothetical protein